MKRKPKSSYRLIRDEITKRDKDRNAMQKIKDILHRQSNDLILRPEVINELESVLDEYHLELVFDGIPEDETEGGPGAVITHICSLNHMYQQDKMHNKYFDAADTSADTLNEKKTA